eukprot:2664833-Amphidinium_carterae.1
MTKLTLSALGPQHFRTCTMDASPSAFVRGHLPSRTQAQPNPTWSCCLGNSHANPRSSLCDVLHQVAELVDACQHPQKGLVRCASVLNLPHPSVRPSWSFANNKTQDDRIV